MTYNTLKFNRHQNAARHAVFSNASGSRTANFAPLWQLGAIGGGALGALKGGLEQSDDGSQIGAGSRLLRVGSNALVGAGLGGLAGGGTGQLLRESPDALKAAAQLENTTGINLSPAQIPLDEYTRIQQVRQAAERAKQVTPPNRLVNTVQGVARTGIEDAQNFVIDPAKAIPGKVTQTISNVFDSPAVQQQKAIARDSANQQAAIINDQVQRLRYDMSAGNVRIDPATNKVYKQVFVKGQPVEKEVFNYSPQTIKALSDQTRAENTSVAQRVVGATAAAPIGGATGSLVGGALGTAVLPGVGTAIGAGIGGTVGTAVAGGVGYAKGINNVITDGIDAGKKALAAPYIAGKTVAEKTAPIRQSISEGIDRTKQLADELKTGGQTPMNDTANPLVQGVMKADRWGKNLTNQLGNRFGLNLNLSYMGDTADFMVNPYLTGAPVGAVLGTGIGAGLGLADSVNDAYDDEQRQLDMIQAIPDPYARKKEWDVYDDDLSRTGRATSHAVQGVGNTLAGAGLGAAGGALLGGGLLTAYDNIRSGKYSVTGRPQPSRLKGLKVFLTGRGM